MRRARGYVLLELLVAVAIFAVLAALAWGGLDAVVRTRVVTDAAAARLAAVQRSVGVLERDLREAVARPVRGPAGERRPALIGGASTLELTHASFISLSVPRSAALARSRWAYDGGRLLRGVDPVLDRAPGPLPAPVAMLEAVESFTLRYLDPSGTWRDEWPVRTVPPLPADALPRAVEFRLQLGDLGEITRLVELAEGGQR